MPAFQFVFDFYSGWVEEWHTILGKEHEFVPEQFVSCYLILYFVTMAIWFLLLRFAKPKSYNEKPGCLISIIGIFIPCRIIESILLGINNYYISMWVSIAWLVLVIALPFFLVGMFQVIRSIKDWFYFRKSRWTTRTYKDLPDKGNFDQEERHQIDSLQRIDAQQKQSDKYKEQDFKEIQDHQCQAQKNLSKAATILTSLKTTYIPCDSCEGHYTFDLLPPYFSFCSEFPSCKSHLTMPEFVLAYIKKYGINIYRWKRKCYRCGKMTAVHSYYLSYDLQNAKIDKVFDMLAPFLCGLGDLTHIDNLLHNKYPTIQMRYSQSVGFKYMANICEHCGALQGKNYIVDDPHEIWGELHERGGMQKYFVETIMIDIDSKLLEDLEVYFDL